MPWHQFPRESPMRILASAVLPALAVLTSVTVLTATPAPGQTYSPDYPVCLHAYRWGGDYFECAYTSLAQCNMSAPGRGTCDINPYYAGPQARQRTRDRRRPVY